MPVAKKRLEDLMIIMKIDVTLHKTYTGMNRLSIRNKIIIVVHQFQISMMSIAQVNQLVVGGRCRNMATVRRGLSRSKGMGQVKGYLI